MSSSPQCRDTVFPLGWRTVNVEGYQVSMKYFLIQSLVMLNLYSSRFWLPHITKKNNKKKQLDLLIIISMCYFRLSTYQIWTPIEKFIGQNYQQLDKSQNCYQACLDAHHSRGGTITYSDSHWSQMRSHKELRHSEPFLEFMVNRLYHKDKVWLFKYYILFLNAWCFYNYSMETTVRR